MHSYCDAHINAASTYIIPSTADIKIIYTKLRVIILNIKYFEMVHQQHMAGAVAASPGWRGFN